MRVRRLSAALLALAAAVLLSGCVKFLGVSTSQPGTVGPVRVVHTVCVVLGGDGSVCPQGSASGVGEGAAQLLVAYRVPSWAPDPTGVVMRADDQVLAFTRDSSYEAALLTTYPGLARTGMRWVGFRSAPTPALAANTAVIGQIEATFDLPDDITLNFSHFVVSGFRQLGDGALVFSPTRAVKCGNPLPPSPTDPQDAACATHHWPFSNADVTVDENEQVVRNRLQLTAPTATTEVQAGQQVQLTFAANGTPILPGATVPLSASTTAPGATASTAASLVLASGRTAAVQVDVPRSTPPGTYEVRLFAGADGAGRSATATLRVLAPPTPAATPTPSVTPAPGATPPPSSTPAAADPSTFAGSVETAASVLGAAGARQALKRGKLRIQVRASAKGRVIAELRTGKTVLAKGRVSARKRGLVTVKLKLTAAGTKALAGRAAITGSLRVRFTPAKGKATTTSVAVTIPTS